MSGWDITFLRREVEFRTFFFSSRALDASASLRYRQLLPDIVLHVGRTHDRARSAADVQDDVRKQLPVPCRPSAAGRRAARAPTPTACT